MIGLTISYHPLNASFLIQSLQFTSVPWSNTPRKQFNNFKHAIFWNTPSTPFYKARQACYLMKHVKHAILWSTSGTPFYEALQARQFFEARQGRKYAKYAGR